MAAREIRLIQRELNRRRQAARLKREDPATLRQRKPELKIVE